MEPFLVTLIQSAGNIILKLWIFRLKKIRIFFKFNWFLLYRIECGGNKRSNALSSRKVIDYYPVSYHRESARSAPNGGRTDMTVSSHFQVSYRCISKLYAVLTINIFWSLVFECMLWLYLAGFSTYLSLIFLYLLLVRIYIFVILLVMCVLWCQFDNNADNMLYYT